MQMNYLPPWSSIGEIRVINTVEATIKLTQSHQYVTYSVMRWEFGWNHGYMTRTRPFL
ncbi:hypothetical protein [Viridibacillus arvi]